MSEEKKAIERIKFLIKEIKCQCDICKLNVVTFKIILNLIDKQQKEIEEWRNGIRINDKVSIPKDKIRAKIEKLKEIADEDNTDNYIKIDALEELLEESQDDGDHIPRID